MATNIIANNEQGIAVAVGWDHLHLRSLDPQQAADFYVQMFDAVPLPPVQTANGLRCIVDLSGLRLFIEQVPPDAPAPPEPPHLGLEHVGLVVEDLQAYAAELKRKGAVFSTEPKRVRPDVQMAFVRGPDRVLIELIERTPA